MHENDSTAPIKLHLGSGPLTLAGWINVDNAGYAGVDHVLDVTKGLPFENAALIFAEHFVEHLAYSEAQQLFRECRRVLNEQGVLRVSTPNLDWVWATHYKPVMTDEEQVLACFAINRAFRGWGHQFLYNERTLSSTLKDAGFGHIVRCHYGESGHELLRGLERHERSQDLPGISHILILEASGRGGAAPPYFDDPREMYLRDLDVK